VWAAGVRIVAAVAVRPLPGLAGSAAVAATAGAALGGPVAAGVAAAYALAAASACYRWHARRRRQRCAVAAVEAVGALLAELRAGLTTSLAGGSAFTGDPAGPAAARVRSAVQISERLGAPLADVLDRVEADLRSAQRLQAMVGAQMAGVRATALLLAALPVAGVLVGTGLGADPVQQLLHTTIGAGCAGAAVAMQAAGLAFTAWLTGRAVAEAS
jgi:tight adherence protein B